MGFGGSVQAMITSLKNNKRERKPTFRRKGENYQTPVVSDGIKDTKKMSAIELQQFRAKIQEANQRRERKFWLLFGSVLVLFLLLGMYFLFYF